MKIVIVGAGISGCATYLFLNKHLPQPPLQPHEYAIYESHDISVTAPSTEHQLGNADSVNLALGGWLGIGPNGLKILKRLDEQIWTDVVRGGYPYSDFRLKKTDGQTVWQSGGAAKDSSSVILSRDSFWRYLKERVPPHLIVNKQVSRVQVNPTGRHVVEFADGRESVEADMVIGADGLKSAVKRSIFTEQGENPYPPHYEGLVGTGGFIPVSEAIQPTLLPGSLTIVFGKNNNSFGYVYPEQFDTSSPDQQEALTTNRMISWWSVYATHTCLDPRTIDKEEATKHLRERHASWQDPVVQQVIQNARIESMYPVRTTPELPTWERDGIILIGDAAHTLPPVLGQGSSQALEDGEALSLFLAHHLQEVYQGGSSSRGMTERDAIRVAARQYMDLRVPRVRAILNKAKSMQQSNWTSGLASGGDRMASVQHYDVAEEIEKVLSVRA